MHVPVYEVVFDRYDDASLALGRCSLQVLPNALKSSRGASSSERSRSASHKEGKTVGKKRKLTTLEEIRFVSVSLFMYFRNLYKTLHVQLLYVIPSTMANYTHTCSTLIKSECISTIDMPDGQFYCSF